MSTGLVAPVEAAAPDTGRERHRSFNLVSAKYGPQGMPHKVSGA
jgi:hypothetical protein